MRGKPCAKLTRTPKPTSATGGRTGSSPAPPSSRKTDRRVFQCREWIPDEPIEVTLMRLLREAEGDLMTIKELMSASRASWNTVQKYMETLVASGDVEAGFTPGNPGRGRARQKQRAYRIKGG